MHTVDRRARAPAASSACRPARSTASRWCRRPATRTGWAAWSAAQRRSSARPLRAPPPARSSAARENDERLAATVTPSGRARRASRRRAGPCIAQARASRRATRAARRDQDATPMKRARHRALLRDAAATPTRARRPSSNTPACSSCWPPCCCRRRPPTSASTRRRARCSPVANTPQTDARARRRQASTTCITHHRPVPHQGEEPDRDLPHRWSSSTAARCRATREALEALPGVGRKTANVVLNIAFGEPTMAVDTHIFRVANRTGLATGQDAARGRRRSCSKRVPAEYLPNAHHWLILHGRYVCLARRPLCERVRCRRAGATQRRRR